MAIEPTSICKPVISNVAPDVVAQVDVISGTRDAPFQAYQVSVAVLDVVKLVPQNGTILNSIPAELSLSKLKFELPDIVLVTFHLVDISQALKGQSKLTSVRPQHL